MTFEQLAGEAGAAAVFGEGASAEEAYGLLTVDVPATSWVQALTAARDVLGCTYFDWLSAVDEPGEGFFVAAHVVAVGTPPRRLLVRTRVPHDAPALPTATGVYAGAAWHERETYEMFGVDFTGHPHLVPLLLPEGFEGHPLRKEFVLAARVAKAWPGAKEPGESEQGGPKRRQMLPPGVPDPNEWGPMKGKLPAEPARERPARGARPGRPARPERSDRPEPGERPERPERPERRERPAGTDRPRRTRTAGDGSASQSTQAQPPRAEAARSDAPWQQAEPESSEGPQPGKAGQADQADQAGQGSQGEGPAGREERRSGQGKGEGEDA